MSSSRDCRVVGAFGPLVWDNDLRSDPTCICCFDSLDLHGNTHNRFAFLDFPFGRFRHGFGPSAGRGLLYLVSVEFGGIRCAVLHGPASDSLLY